MNWNLFWAELLDSISPWVHLMFFRFKLLYFILLSKIVNQRPRFQCTRHTAHAVYFCKGHQLFWSVAFSKSQSNVIFFSLFLLHISIFQQRSLLLLFDTKEVDATKFKFEMFYFRFRTIAVSSEGINWNIDNYTVRFFSFCFWYKHKITRRIGISTLSM